MTNTRLVSSLLLALAVLASASPLEAQGITDRLKKKVGEKVNTGDKKDPATTNAAVAADQSKAPTKITDVVMTAFIRGLETERDRRKATVKFLSTIKTREQYSACQSTLAAGPEMQKIMMSLGNLPENATQEQTQKASQKMQADMEKLVKDKCGEDPNIYNDGWRRRQADSAEAAGIRAFSAALGTSQGGGGPFLSLERPESAPDNTELYRFLKEWITPFCHLSEAAREEAAKQGVRIPGTGTGMYYVYTAEEAKVIMKVCGRLEAFLEEMQ